MRKIDKFEKVNEANFKRLVGVKRSTFEVMVEEYKKAEEERKKGQELPLEGIRKEGESLSYVKKIECYLCSNITENTERYIIWE